MYLAPTETHLGNRYNRGQHTFKKVVKRLILQGKKVTSELQNELLTLAQGLRTEKYEVSPLSILDNKTKTGLKAKTGPIFIHYVLV